MSKKFVLTLAISLFSMQTFAASFGVFDPRSLAMGGTGVASGDASNASHYNPALLSLTHEDDDFSLVIPAVAAGISDPNDLEDAFDAYDAANYETALDSAITTFNVATLPSEFIANSSALATSVQNLKNGINTLSGKSLVINANAAVLLAIPSKSIAVSVYSSGRAVGGANLTISNADNTLIQDYIDVLACIGALDSGTAVSADIQNCDALSPSTDVLDGTGDFNNASDIATTLTSTANLRGAVISEVGISLAHKFESLGGLSIGITPKSIKVDTFDSAIGIDTVVDIDNGRKSYSDTNIDVGLAMKLTENIKVGLVAKNIISKEYKTILNNTVKLEPQYRAGVAYQNDWVLLSADLDLTENEGFGFESKSKNAAIGVELDLWDTLQFRAGYSQNLSNDTAADDGIASVGIGISPFGVHIDLAVASNDSGIQGGFQLGFKF